MLRLKANVVAKCDECGATRKEQAAGGSSVESALGRLEDEGWRIGERPFEDGCRCPACAEADAAKRGRS